MVFSNIALGFTCKDLSGAILRLQWDERKWTKVLKNELNQSCSCRAHGMKLFSNLDWLLYVWSPSGWFTTWIHQCWQGFPAPSCWSAWQTTWCPLSPPESLAPTSGEIKVTLIIDARANFCFLSVESNQILQNKNLILCWENLSFKKKKIIYLCKIIKFACFFFFFSTRTHYKRSMCRKKLCNWSIAWFFDLNFPAIRGAIFISLFADSHFMGDLFLYACTLKPVLQGCSTTLSGMTLYRAYGKASCLSGVYLMVRVTHPAQDRTGQDRTG